MNDNLKARWAKAQAWVTEHAMRVAAVAVALAVLLAICVFSG